MVFAPCKFPDLQEHFPSSQKQRFSLDGLSVQPAATH